MQIVTALCMDIIFGKHIPAERMTSCLSSVDLARRSGLSCRAPTPTKTLIVTSNENW